MVILTGEHKDRYLKMLKQSYESDIRLIERIENDYDINFSEEELEEFKSNIEELKALYDAGINLEQIYLDTNYKFRERNSDLIWWLVFLTLFGGELEEIPTPKDDTIN